MELGGRLSSKSRQKNKRKQWATKPDANMPFYCRVINVKQTMTNYSSLATQHINLRQK